MPALPIDPSFTAVVIRSAPLMRDGAAVTDREGQPLSGVEVTTDPELAERLELVTIRVPVAVTPTLPLGTRVRFEALVARPWEHDGRAGVTFTAAKVIAIQAQPPARPASPTPTPTA